jgi:hypothetical protein
MSTNAEITPETLDRINVARHEVRRAIASDTLALIHPFDLAKLLGNPMTLDAVIVHIEGHQYIVIDGTAYRCTSDVKNVTPLKDMMPEKHTPNTGEVMIEDVVKESPFDHLPEGATDGNGGNMKFDTPEHIAGQKFTPLAPKCWRCGIPCVQGNQGSWMCDCTSTPFDERQNSIDHCPRCGEYLHDEMGHMCPSRTEERG